MVALSFGSFAATPAAYSPSIFTIGKPAPVAKSPTDFQYAPAKPIAKSPTDFQYSPAPSAQAAAPLATSRPPLSFGDAVPKMTSLFNKRAELSYGTAVPASANTGFGSSGFVSNFLSTMSMGTKAPVAKSPTDFQYAPPAQTTRQTPIVTVDTAGRSGMQEFAQDMAGQIFDNMFKQPAAPIAPTLAGGASGTFGGGSAGGGLSGGEIAIAAGALILVLFLMSGRKSGGGSTRRKSTRRARK
jgi:hypothetical protein